MRYMINTLAAAALACDDLSPVQAEDLGDGQYAVEIPQEAVEQIEREGHTADNVESLSDWIVAHAKSDLAFEAIVFEDAEAEENLRRLFDESPDEAAEDAAVALA